MDLDKKVELAIKRINYILKDESNKIIGAFPSGDGTVLIALSNGMNFHLTSGEMEFRADEQLEEEATMQMDRDDVVDEITQNYVEQMHTDMNEGDFSFIFPYIRGDGGTQIDRLTNEELVVEYKELFSKDIIIND